MNATTQASSGRPASHRHCSGQRLHRRASHPHRANRRSPACGRRRRTHCRPHSSPLHRARARCPSTRRGSCPGTRRATSDRIAHRAGNRPPHAASAPPRCAPTGPSRPSRRRNLTGPCASAVARTRHPALKPRPPPPSSAKQRPRVHRRRGNETAHATAQMLQEKSGSAFSPTPPRSRHCRKPPRPCARTRFSHDPSPCRCRWCGVRRPRSTRSPSPPTHRPAARRAACPFPLPRPPPQAARRRHRRRPRLPTASHPSTSRAMIAGTSRPTPARPGLPCRESRDETHAGIPPRRRSPTHRREHQQECRKARLPAWGPRSTRRCHRSAPAHTGNLVPRGRKIHPSSRVESAAGPSPPSPAFPEMRFRGQSPHKAWTPFRNRPRTPRASSAPSRRTHRPPCE